jgi:hypothetical protein
MEVRRYAIDQTLVVLIGDPYIDPYPSQQKYFCVENRIYKNIRIHLFDEFPCENYDLATDIKQALSVFQTEIVEKSQKNLKCGIEFYVHHEWMKISQYLIKNHSSKDKFDIRTIIPWLQSRFNCDNNIFVYKFFDLNQF